MNRKSKQVLIIVLVVFAAINVFSFFFSRDGMSAQTAYELCKEVAVAQLKWDAAKLPEFGASNVQQTSKTAYRWDHQGEDSGFSCTVTGSSRKDAQVNLSRFGS